MNISLKHVTWLLFVVIHLNGYAQLQWSPPSAKWTYEGNGNEGYNYVEIRYKKDTTVLDKNAKVLVKQKFRWDFIKNQIISYYIGQEVIHIEDSVVYLYKNNAFDTLYSFNSPIGTSWKLNCSASINGEGSVATILEKGDTVINGQNLIYTIVDFNFGAINVQDTIIEKIGSTQLYLLPCERIEMMLDGHEGEKLRCYSDHNLGLFSNNFKKPCDYLTSGRQYEIQPPIHVYPNPVSDYIIVEIQNKEWGQISIRNSTGQVLLTQRITTLPEKLNVSFVPTGLLILEISTPSSSYIRKIIKN